MHSINFSPFPELTTERLRIRQLVADDANEIFKLRSDDRVNRFIGRSKCKSIEEAGAFINKINRSISNNESVYWGLALKENNKLVGTICLWNMQPENYRSEIGYELHPDYWGKGIMREAMAKVISYAFETLKLHTIEADTVPDNLQSVLVLEKNGFIKEGHFRESLYSNGMFIDKVVYTLLNTKNKISS